MPYSYFNASEEEGCLKRVALCGYYTGKNACSSSPYVLMWTKASMCNNGDAA